MGGSASDTIDIPDSVPDGPLRDWLTWLQDLRQRAGLPSLKKIADKSATKDENGNVEKLSTATVRRLLTGKPSQQSAFRLAWTLAEMDTRPVTGKPSDDWDAFDRDMRRRCAAALGAVIRSGEEAPHATPQSPFLAGRTEEADASRPTGRRAPEAMLASGGGHAPSKDRSTVEALDAAEKATAAPRITNLRSARHCVGRGEELVWLRRALTGHREGAATTTVIVTGLGGVGKSTLASEYARLYRDDYPVVWWVNAASPAQIETSLLELTGQLVPGRFDAEERTARVDWAMQWLGTHSDWLLIYDNVDNPRHLFPYTGVLDRGHHLATSRRTTGWADNTPILPLDVLRPDDATKLLNNLVYPGTTPSPRQEADFRALTADLGNLPLALRQAGAYLAQNRGITVQAYRRRLESKLDKKALATRAERTMARIWDVTLDALQDVEPLAVEVLHTAAWLAPDDIPHTLLAPPGTDSDDTAEAIGTLAAYSMLTDTGTHVSVHRLVQTVLRTSHATPGGTQPPPCPPGRLRAEQAVLHRLTPPPDQDYLPAALLDALSPHLVALAATTPPGHFNSALGMAYHVAARLLSLQGHDARTVPLLKATVVQYEQDLGDTHPETLTLRNNLASAYQAAGDLTRAIPLFETTLAQCEQVLGDTHPDTLGSRNNLACAYEAAGDLTKAIPLHESILAQRAQDLGDLHPDTLTSRNNLACAYEAAGDLTKAIPLLESTLAQREQVLGDTDPDTLGSRNNLACAYRDAGDLTRAIPLFETTLAQCEQVHGDTHPLTLGSRNILACAYEAVGDLVKAIPLLESTLVQREQVLGDLHPDTLTSRDSLACAYQNAGDLTKAIPLLESTLAQREQVLGATHLDTLTSRNNLACAYRDAGDLTKAIPLLESTLAQREQILGATHPDTLTSRHNLAGAHYEAEDLDRAIPLLEITLAQCQQVLGANHPDTRESRMFLAQAYLAAQSPHKALALLLSP
ncbi:tetratricopeptide repeat protein [Streptomyces albidocamelliae]|uniref:Tetratricopeptide repeat protein n=1 Tax=Streptomyces albidocamelliae TaxID=2981135 RepID=A0ABY6F1F8_9ACTN|nr:tetratricopeptide repeat protein [Streptomyces sp. HUAS 14-6]UXY40492.1 tetratricopeptide repeat protein [Streptomyces sp. HUAS 14-6]